MFNKWKGPVYERNNFGFWWGIWLRNNKVSGYDGVAKIRTSIQERFLGMDKVLAV